jgi:hypothetical protein
MRNLKGGIFMKNKTLSWGILFSLATMVFFIPAFAAPQPVDDFLGVPWGSTMQQVEKALKPRKGFKQIPLDEYYQQWIKEKEAPGYGQMDFNGTVANHFAHVMFIFQNNSLYEGSLHFVDQNQPASFKKLNKYSSEWKNKKYILNLYDEIKGMLIQKYGEPERENEDRAYFTDESITNFLQIDTRWSLKGGTAGDEINVKCEGVSPYYINKQDGLKTTGYVAVTYSNQSLQKSLLNSKPVNTSNDL